MPVTATRGLPLPAQSGPAFATSISANNRYLLDQHGQPFMVNADSGWDIAHALNATDQATYVADRVNNGFNTLLVDLVGNGVNGTNAGGANWNGEVPFTGGNLATPNNTYWARVDTLMQMCVNNGMSTFVQLMDPYSCGTGEVFAGVTTTQAQAYGTYLAQRYPKSLYPGVVWFFGNDWDQTTPSNAVYKAALAGVQSQGDIRPVITEGTPNGPNNAADLIDSTWMTLNGCYSEYVSYDTMLTAYAAITLPTIFIEGPYENSVIVAGITNLNLREMICWPMTCGATGTFYGNDSLWRFATGWQAQLDTTAVAQRKILNNVFKTIAWWKLVPDVNSQLVTAGRGSQSTGESTGAPWSNSTFNHYVTAAYSADGTVAAVYNPNSSLNTITLSSSVLGPTPVITKVDPTSGTTTNLGWTSSPSGGTNAGGDHDWLYLISAA